MSEPSSDRAAAVGIEPPNDRMLSLAQLEALIEEGEIDTVVLAFTDMQGRLQGKRLHATYFRDVAIESGTEGCNYLLAVDIDMNTVDGYAISSWNRGYGDMEFVPDWRTIRRLTYLPSTAMIQCDLTWLDHQPVLQDPRTMLRHQLARLEERGWVALAGSELEFVMFEDTYEAAWKTDYRDLTPSNLYNVDYSILGTTRVEPLLRDIRNHMYAAGMEVEGAKGECNLGQHEIGFLYAEALATCDNHSVYKNAAKEIAAQHGRSITFMAKLDDREGSSCHIHLSLRGADGELVFWDEETDERSALYDHFVAGVLATMEELTLLYAPNINSYKRFMPGSFAPTAVAWGLDNRTCAVRLVGRRKAARMENRLPGGDVNPYLAVAAMLAGGLHGIEQELPLGEEMKGNAYESDAPHVPITLQEARDLFAGSEVARSAFGDEVVDHYVNMADVELQAFNAHVTDWELRRGFERM
jgi:glutamine synthetase